MKKSIFKMFVCMSVCFFCLLITRQTYALSISLNQAPLSDLVEWVSKATTKNIIIASDVSALVTFNVQDIEHKDIWPFFEKLLSAYDLSLENKGYFYLVSQSQHDQEFEQQELEQLVIEPITERIYKLEHITFASVADALAQVAPGATITQLPGTQSIFISGSESALSKIDFVLPVLDVPGHRILVEAVVMEISANKFQEVGVSVTAILNNARLIASSSFGSVSLPGAYVDFVGNEFRSVVTALNGLADVNLLSNPRILVSPGQRGSVIVGQNVPFITGRSVGEAGDAKTPFQTIEREDVGLSLTVQPFVISERLIDLVLVQDVSSVSTATIASDLITDKRSFQTRITVAPGEWITLGGLISTKYDLSSVGVPGLMQLPFIGPVFRVDRRDEVKRDLSVLLRVTLV